MSNEEKLIKAIQDVSVMKADLFWCLGKLRGLGYPAKVIEERWGVDATDPETEGAKTSE